MHLIAVVLYFRKLGGFLQFDFDWLREHLLTGEHHGVFHGCVEIAEANLWRMRTRGLEKIGQRTIDARDFLANVFDDGTGGTAGWKVAAYDFYHAGNSGERIANLVSQSRRQFPEGG